MLEPRGHHEMFGAILLEPDAGHEDKNGEKADMAVIFIHNDGERKTALFRWTAISFLFFLSFLFLHSKTRPITLADGDTIWLLTQAFTY